MSVYNVANSAELSTALSRVVGGDTIRLATGNYGEVRLFAQNPNNLVTIESANSAAPAHLDTLWIGASQNLAFRNLDIGRALTPTEGDYTRMIEINNASRIVFDELNVHGSLDGLPNDGFGLFANNVAGIVVTNSVFKEHTKGVLIQMSDNLQIANNRFIDMRQDGINVAASNKVLVDGNLFQGFYPKVGDHGDAIQFYNAGQTRGSSDITIRNNILLPGGTGPQGIQISDATYPYSNVLIENNVLWSTGLFNGIGIIGVNGGTRILNNTVVSSLADTKQFWITFDRSSDLLVTGNVTDNILVQNAITNLREYDNISFARNPSARGLFRNLETPTSVDDLITPGHGYQKPLVVDTAPVSGAIGGGLASLLSHVTGSAVEQIAVHDDDQLGLSSGTVPLTGLNAIAANAAPMAGAMLSMLPVQGDSPMLTFSDSGVALHATSVSMHGFGSGHMMFDHFTALP